MSRIQLGEATQEKWRLYFACKWQQRVASDLEEPEPERHGFINVTCVTYLHIS